MYHLPSVHEIITALGNTVPDALDDTFSMSPPRPCDGDTYVISSPENPFVQDRSDHDIVWGLDTDDSVVPHAPTDIFGTAPDTDEGEILNGINPWGNDEFKRVFEEKAVDALAWYVPFHYVKRQHGIYISARGLSALLTGCIRQGWQFPNNLGTALDICFYALLRHEVFHFATECMATNQELLGGQAVYLSARQALGKKSGAGYVVEEEALANAYMLRGFRYPSSKNAGSRLFPALKSFTKRMPTGYRDGHLSVATENYLSGCNSLGSLYQRESMTGRSAMGVDFVSLYPNIKKVNWRRCPVYFVDEDGLFDRFGLSPQFVQVLPRIVETKKLKKMLGKMRDPRITQDWQQTLVRLKQSTQYSGLDFKPWPKAGKDYFSVRVNKGARAHLRFDRSTGTWFAEEIGHHDQMKH